MSCPNRQGKHVKRRRWAKSEIRTWAANCMGNTDESATRTLVKPYTRRSVSTTPPCSSGSMAHVEEGWNCVPTVPVIQLSQSSSVVTFVPGTASAYRTFASGWVCEIWRMSLDPARRRTRSNFCGCIPTRQCHQHVAQFKHTCCVRKIFRVNSRVVERIVRRDVQRTLTIPM